MNERAITVRVNGLVQGVGYRAFVQAEALRLGLRGWVVNCADLVGAMRKGPAGARIDGLDLRSSDRGAVEQAPHDAWTFP